MNGRAPRGRRIIGLAGAAALASVLSAALTACGGNPDPYAVLDQARTASYERIQVNLGLELEVPTPIIPDAPELQGQATSVRIDPSWITAAADFPARSYYLRLAIPMDQLGLPAQGMLGLPFASLDIEALADPTDLYVKSPLLPLALQNGIDGVPIEGDLTGWVRFKGVAALAQMAPAMFGIPLLPEAGADIVARLPLPSPGDVTGVKDLLTEMGATVEFAGTETVDGRELLHLKGGVRIATLAASRPFLALTGMSPEEIRGLTDLDGQVGIATEVWVEKSTGRLATLRIDGTTAEEPATTVAVILRVAEPGPEITFAAPATFVDVDITELMGNQLGGFAPAVPVLPTGGMEEQVIEDILDDVGEELANEAPVTP